VTMRLSGSIMRPIFKATFSGALLSLAVLSVQAQPGRGPMPGPGVYPGAYGPVVGSAPVYGTAPAYVGSPQGAGYGSQGPTRFGPGPEAAPSPYGRQPGYPSSPYSRSNTPGPQGPPADTSKMQEALRQQDYERLDQENQGLRNRTRDLEGMKPELPVEDRLKLPLINHMYRKGSDTIDRGRDRQDPSTIKMGIQQINEANRNLDRLRGPEPQGSGRGDQNGSRGGQSQNRSQGNRRGR